VDVVLKSALYVRWIENHEKRCGVLWTAARAEVITDTPGEVSLLQTVMRAIEGGGGHRFL